jgi:hypothetical protein
MIIYNYIYKRCLQFKCNAKHGEDEMDCINVKSCYLSYHLDPLVHLLFYHSSNISRNCHLLASIRHHLYLRFHHIPYHQEWEMEEWDTEEWDMEAAGLEVWDTVP